VLFLNQTQFIEYSKSIAETSGECFIIYLKSKIMKTRLDEKWIVKHDVDQHGQLYVWIEEERTRQLICDFEYSANSDDQDEVFAKHIVEIHNLTIL